MIAFRPQLQKLEDRLNPAPLAVPPVPLATASQSITQALMTYQSITSNGQAIINSPQLRALASQQASQAVTQLIAGLQSFSPLANSIGALEALNAATVDVDTALAGAGASNAERAAASNAILNLATPLVNSFGGLTAVNTQAKVVQLQIQINNQISAGNNLLAALSVIQGFIVGLG